MKFYLNFPLSSIISSTKGYTILLFTENICQLIFSNSWNHINYFNFQILY